MTRYCVPIEDLGRIEETYIIVSGPHPSPELCTLACDATNLLTNGDFSLPASVGCTGLQNDSRQRDLAAPPWYFNNNCTTHYYCDPATPGYQTNRFVGFNWYQNNCAIQQPVSTVAGQTYSCSFDMGSQPGYNQFDLGTRHIEVVVYALTPSELEQIQTWPSGIDDSITVQPFSQTILQTSFSVPPLITTNTYEGLGWQTKSFSFTATSAATLIRFRAMNTLVGSPNDEVSNVVIDNVSLTIS